MIAMATSSQTQSEKVHFSKVLGARIQHCRRSNAWSQEQLAEKSGFYRTYIGRVENGGIAVSMYTIWKIAHALQIDLGDLLRDL